MHIFRLVAVALCALPLLAGCGKDATVPPTASAPPAVTASDPASQQLRADGIAALRTGEYTEAAKLFRAAYERDPANYLAYADAGIARSLLGEYTAAHELLARAEQTAPNDPVVLYNFALHYKLQGDLTAAESYFRRLLAVVPAHAWGLYGLATIHADRGEEAAAMDYLARAVAADPATATAAREQDHFSPYRDRPGFRRIVGE